MEFTAHTGNFATGNATSKAENDTKPIPIFQSDYNKLTTIHTLAKNAYQACNFSSCEVGFSSLAAVHSLIERAPALKPENTLRSILMALVDTSRPLFTGRSSADLLGHSAHGLFARFMDWRDRRATKAALEALSNRELDDIGLTRGDLERI